MLRYGVRLRRWATRDTVSARAWNTYGMRRARDAGEKSTETEGEASHAEIDDFH